MPRTVKGWLCTTDVGDVQKDGPWPAWGFSSRTLSPTDKIQIAWRAFEMVTAVIACCVLHVCTFLGTVFKNSCCVMNAAYSDVATTKIACSVDSFWKRDVDYRGSWARRNLGRSGCGSVVAPTELEICRWRHACAQPSAFYEPQPVPLGNFGFVSGCPASRTALFHSCCRKGSPCQ